MATVGVIAVLMSIAALGLGRRHADLETAHQELANTIRELRLRASLKGAHYRLSPAVTTYEIARLRDADADGIWEPDPASEPRVVELPPGVKIAAAKQTGETTAVEFDTRGVMVDPDGGPASIVQIVLTGGRDEQRTVEIWPSGQVQRQTIVGAVP